MKSSPKSFRIALALLGPLMVGGCRTEPRAQKPPRPVRVAPSAASTCAVPQVFSGLVEPGLRVELAFRRPGRIEWLLGVRDAQGARLAEPGDVVRKGAVLARLEQSEYRLKQEQARADLARASVELDQVNQDQQRTERLFASGAVAAAALEGARFRALAAASQVRAASALVDETTLALDDCVLRAPMDAVLYSRHLEVGSLVSAGTLGFVLADTASMKVVFGVPDVMLPRIPVGATFDVSLEALGSESLVGRVRSVAPSADPKSRLFNVELALSNADGRLRAGMVASLRMAEPRAALPLSVPVSAVLRPPGQSRGFAVFVLVGDVVRVREIEPRRLCGGRVEVAAGLAPNEQVVVDGSAQAYDGETVAVVL